MEKESKIAQLQAQVEASSAEKVAPTAKFEAIVKENEGEIFVWFVIQYMSKKSLRSFLKCLGQQEALNIYNIEMRWHAVNLIFL